MINFKRFSTDLFANYIAFGFTAVSGLLFLYVCAKFLGMDGLGVVSQVMALYLIFGQLAVVGIQFSSLKSSSDPALSVRDKSLSVWSAVLVALIWASLFSLISFFLSQPIGLLLDSPRVAEAWKITSPSLLFFAVNKVLASALNGLNKMRHFALQMSLRALLMLLFSFILAFHSQDPVLVCYTFLFTEVIITIYLLSTVYRFIGFPDLNLFSSKEFFKHLKFGLKGIWSGLAYEFNTKMDVVMVGVFMSDTDVGLYSLVAQLAEGFFNLLVVLRNQLAPLISELISPPNVEELKNMSKQLTLFVLPTAAFLALIGTSLYIPVIEWALPEQGFDTGWYLLAILLAGIVLNSWIMPMDTVLIVSGNPGYYSIMMGAVSITNILSNIILIYLFGIIGAAIATCLSTILSGFYLLSMIRFKLGFWLLPQFQSKSQ